MTGTTISGSYTTGVTLSNPAIQNPATLNGTGHINVSAISGSALYGTNAAAWSVYNYGTLIAPTRGVFLTAGGTVTNESGGLISGGHFGVDITGAAGAVVNAGSIAGGTQPGVKLTDGGSVTNVSGGQISGGGTYGAIYIRHGGTVSNGAGATITGPVQIYDSAGTVTNAGSINAGSTSTNGVQLFAGGSVTNTSGATIGAAIGIYLPTGTVANAGSIIGKTDAIQSNGTGVAFLTNLSSGVLNGATAIAGGASTVLSVNNAGTITGSAFGVSAQDVGTISNASGAVITAGTSSSAAIYLAGGSITNAGSIYGWAFAVSMGGAGVLTNAGTITGGAGIAFHNGGTVTNLSGGTISSDAISHPVYFRGSAGTVVNYGSIIGTNGPSNGIVMLAGGSVTNEAGGLIDAISIAVVNVHDTVSNAGTITGVINISGGAGASVINTTGGTISGGTIIAQTILNEGLIVGGFRNFISDASITNAASGTFANNAGYLSGLVNYGVISGVTGANVGILTNAGTITGTGGTAVQAGELIVDPGAQFNGTVAGSALYLATGNGGTLAGFGTSIVNFGSITFETGSEWTIAGNTLGLSGVISGFAQADTIDLTGLSETVQDYTAGTLTLVGDKTVTLQLPGTFTTASFRTAPDAGTGTDVFLACFAAGTRIATDRGNVPVEHLRVGDHALTVRWIGRRRIDLARHPRPEAARPIRIRRGALSEGVPDRDLLLSPDHAIYAEDVLIPVRWLVNERTVVPARRIRHVEYFHVELDRHAILLAEGMPAESYLDTGDRSAFENGGVAVELYPDFASRTWESGGCARLVVTGPEMEAVRQRLQRGGEGNSASISSVLATGSGHARLPTGRRISRARRSS